MYFTLYGCTRGVSKVTGAPTCAPVFCIHRVIFIYMCTRGTGIHNQYLLYTYLYYRCNFFIHRVVWALEQSPISFRWP